MTNQIVTTLKHQGDAPVGQGSPDFLVWMDRLEERKMPRPKTIDSNDIELKKVNAEVIGQKTA